MENNKKNRKGIFIIVPIVVMVIAVLFAILACIYFINPKQDKGHASIELSAAVDKIYLGGSGEISAILRYSGDGSTATENFFYDSDRPDLVSFEQKEGKYTGKYVIEPKKNSESFNDVIVNVTVSCVDNNDIEPSSMQLTVTDAKPLLLQFYRNQEDTEPTQIQIYQGYSISQINEIQLTSFNIPDYRPSSDYDSEWYDKDTNEFVSINNSTVFYGGSELNIYGRYRLNKSLKLIDELNGDNSHEFQTQLYFGESISDETLLKTLRETLDSTDDWAFEGWVPDLNDIDSENSFNAGLSKGIFVSVNSTLYAKWTSEIYFLHESPDAAGTEVLGTPTFNSVSITYHGNIPKLPEMSYKYADEKIRFIGWFSDIDSYSSDSQIQENEIYSGSAKQKFYDKTSICVTFEDQLNGKKNELWTIYGKSFRQQNISLPSITLRKGWTFEGRWHVEGYGEATENEILGMQYIWAVPISLSAIWNVKIRYFADIGEIKNVYGDGTYHEETIRYGNSLVNVIPYPQGQNNLWYCAGWYVDYSREGERIARMNTSSEEFIELYQNRCVNPDGKGYYLPLYAKWIANIQLDYNNSNFHIGELPAYVEIAYGQDFISQLPDRSQMSAPKGFSHGGGWCFNSSYIVSYDEATASWKNQIASYEYPLDMSRLYYEWNGESDTVTLNCYNADQTDVIFTKQITVRIGDPMPELDSTYIPTGNIPAGQFLGYFYEDVPYYSFYNNKLISARDWDMPKTEGKEYELYAKYGTTYLVTLDATDGDGGTKSIQASNGFPLPAGDFIAPTRTGYTFEGYFDESDSNVQYYDRNMSPTDKIWNSGAGKIVAHWKANKYAVQLNTNGGNALDESPITVEYDSSYGNGTYRDSSNKEVPLVDGKLPIPTKNNVQGDGGYWSYSFEGWFLDEQLITAESNVETAGNHELKAKWNAAWNKTCIITGTLITLADGTQIPVEQLTGQEQILVWNMDTGTFDVSPIFFLAHAETNRNPEFVQVITLIFSDGTDISIAGQHGFWNHTLNKYVFITAQNAKSFIGDWFNQVNIDEQGNKRPERVQLVDAIVHTQLTNVWSPISAEHLCYFANGMLVLPGLTEAFVNIFEVDPETMKYDEEAKNRDIEKYGLFTYEEFSKYLPIPESYFDVFGAKYLKVAFGKGLITWDDIIRLVKENPEFIYSEPFILAF